MATETQSNTDASTAPAPPSVRPYRLSVRQYLRMIEAGVFPGSARVELLGGFLVDKRVDDTPPSHRLSARRSSNGHQEEPMTKGTPHNYSLLALSFRFRGLLTADWLISEEKSLFLGPSSRPEPDLAILRSPVEFYQGRDPNAQDTVLVIEVADFSYRYDRGRKWRRYAAAGIPTYWIVNIAKRQVEVYRDPTRAGAQASYQTTEIYGEDAAVPVVIAGAEVGRLSVRDILP